MRDTDVAVRVAPLFCAPCGRRRPHKTMFLGPILWIKCSPCTTTVRSKDGKRVSKLVILTFGEAMKLSSPFNKKKELATIGRDPSICNSELYDSVSSKNAIPIVDHA